MRIGLPSTFLRIVSLFLLSVVVPTQSRSQAFTPDALKFSLPAVSVNALTVPSRVATITKESVTTAYPGTVLVKTRSSQRPAKNATSFQSVSWKSTLSPLSISRINGLIADGMPVSREERAFGIDRIFEVRFDPAVDVFDACRRIAENPDVEYVTPMYERRTSLVPNDPR